VTRNEEAGFRPLPNCHRAPSRPYMRPAWSLMRLFDEPPALMLTTGTMVDNGPQSALARRSAKMVCICLAVSERWRLEPDCRQALPSLKILLHRGAFRKWSKRIIREGRFWGWAFSIGQSTRDSLDRRTLVKSLLYGEKSPSRHLCGWAGSIALPQNRRGGFSLLRRCNFVLSASGRCWTLLQAFHRTNCLRD